MLPARATFAYDAVPAVSAAVLRAEASRIRKMVNSTTAAIIEIGRALIGVKQSLEHGQFGEWVQAECGFGLRTAENYIRASQFAEGKTKCVSFLNPATVYRLAAKSAPPAIVQAVLDRASNGEIVADAEVVAAFNEVKIQKREAERQQKVTTRRAPSKKLRERYESDRLYNEERRRNEDERIGIIVLSIIERLGEENAGFLIDQLGKFDRWTAIARLGEELTKRRQAVAS
jgi:Protein of unknown function (DUF3102)